MGIKVLKGRNVKVEVATAFGAAKDVSAITKAAPAVVSSIAHGLTAGAVGYFDSMNGMQELDGMAVTVISPTAGTFELPDVDSTGFTSFVTGQFVPVQTWATLANATKVDIGGGDASKLDITTLLDNVKQEEAGMLAAQTVSIDVLAEQSTSAASTFIKAQARKSGFVVVRLTYPNGQRRIFRGQPGQPGESVGVDQVVSGSMSMTVKGYVISTDN